MLPEAGQFQTRMTQERMDEKVRPSVLVIMPRMRKFFPLLLPLVLLFVTACGGQSAATQTTILPTLTLSPDEDPCSSQNLPATIEPINDLMREFDDASQLAANLPAAQLPEAISNLQRIRRATEDAQIPACLSALKTHQLNHMNLMIQTLLAFVGGANQQDLNNGVEQARKEHDLYSLEIVRLLGVTLAPLTATPQAVNTP
jgi:hypothetical protein